MTTSQSASEVAGVTSLSCQLHKQHACCQDAYAWCANTHMHCVRAGQEAVWLKVLPRWGVSREELQAHFGGPAFLAWQRMGNIHSYAGALPLSWIEDQAGELFTLAATGLCCPHLITRTSRSKLPTARGALVSFCTVPACRSAQLRPCAAELQRKIVARMRSLGMTPVFPAFAGLVPDALVARYPQVLCVLHPVWTAGIDIRSCCVTTLQGAVPYSLRVEPKLHLA